MAYQLLSNLGILLGITKDRSKIENVGLEDNVSSTSLPSDTHEGLKRDVKEIRACLEYIHAYRLARIRRYYPQ